MEENLIDLDRFDELYSQGDCNCWIAPGMLDCSCESGRANFIKGVHDQMQKSISLIRRHASDLEADLGYLNLLSDIPSISDSESTKKPREEVDSDGISDSKLRYPKSASGSDAWRWIREITLTQPADNLQPYDLLTSMKKIVASSMFEILHYYACVELTEAGTPHIHMIVWSKAKYFNTSKIKAFHKYRYTCSPVRSVPDYVKYIFKNEKCPLHIDYCKSKGIDQFYASPSLSLQEEVQTQVS